MTQMMHTQPTHGSEHEVREAMARWSAALEAKDLDALIAEYADDAVVIDIRPGAFVVGRDAIRAMWGGSLPQFPKAFRSEYRDVRIVAGGGDVAVAFGEHRIVAPDQPAGDGMWLRFTIAYRKVEGRWLSVHDHVSIPFQPNCDVAK